MSVHRFLLVGAVSGMAGSGACNHDWAAYDPRLGDAGAGAQAGSSGGGPNGNGGAGGSADGGGDCVPDTFSPCYSGPPGTEGVGRCRGGERRCESDGTLSDMCTGEITPAPETCGDPADEDCDGEADESCLCSPGTVVPCYDGPDGTESIGICGPGFKVCNELGNTESACLGQIVPKLEDCSTIVDDDCNATANDHCPAWGAAFGGAGNQTAWDVAADASGNIVIAGGLEGSAVFGGQEVTSAGGSDILVVKLAPGGEVVWVRRFGDPLDQSARAVVVDAAGDVIVAGAFQGTLKLGDTWDAKHSSLGGDDVFVAKLSAGGDHIWSRSFGGPGSQMVRGMDIDAAGSPVVAGELAGSMDLDGAATLASSGMLDAFLFKLLPTGAPAWAKAFGGAGDDAALDVAAGPDGSAHVAGYFSSSINFGGGALPSGGGAEAFIAKLSGAGAHVWSKGTKLASDQRAHGVAVSDQGDVVVLGVFREAMDFGGALATGDGSDDLFVARLDAAGTPLWCEPFGGFADEEPGGVAMGPGGEVYFSAMVEGTADFGGGPIVSEGNDDVVAVKLTESGGHAYSRRFGNFADQDARGLARLPSGGAVMVGDFAGKMNFGEGDLTSAGGRDLFVTELPP